MITPQTLLFRWKNHHHPLVRHLLERRISCRSSSSTTTTTVSPPPPHLPHATFIPEIIHDAADLPKDEPVPIQLQESFQHQTPLVLRQAAASLPAVQSWHSLEYLRQKFAQSQEVGHVEMGASYLNPTLPRADQVPLASYVDYLELFAQQYGSKTDDIWNKDETISSDEILYLAQNDLPLSLQDDVPLPEWLNHKQCLSPEHMGHVYSCMLWLGPKGCGSPLHYDPLDNLLIQIVGRKLVWVLPPGTRLPESHQSNTSTMDLEDPNPNVIQQEVQDIQYTVLHPSDVLYLPRTWWHQVRSLDASASVNVWFR